MFQGRSRKSPKRNAAFTLTEILVVMGILVMLTLLAVPALSWMSGSRSIEGGTNMVAAAVARARMKAVGHDVPRGVLFFRHAESDRRAMVLVEQVQFVQYDDAVDFNEGDYVINGLESYVAHRDPPRGTDVNNTDYWTQILEPDRIPYLLRRVDGEEFNYLPPGVDLHVLDNGDGDPRSSDGYLSTGVILFNKRGQLVITRWALDEADRTVRSIKINPNTNAPLIPSGTLYPEDSPKSGLGVVLFDRRSYVDRVPDDQDPDPDLADYLYAGSTEVAEETWIDEHGTPILVNRYNGTLMRTK